MSIAAEQPDTSTVRLLLDEAGMPAASVEPVGGGRVTWTYVVDDRWIVQFPRYDEVSESLQVQAELMPLVQATVPFMVPVPEPIARYQGQPVMRYRMVPGRPLRADDHWLDVAPMLRALHGVPRESAAEILKCGPTVDAWRSRFAQFREMLDASLGPRLDAQVRDAIAAEYEGFLTDPFDFTPVFVHSDLGAEHILVEQDTCRPSGIIDFDWATVGDPALDFVGLLSALGPGPTGRIIRAYGDGVSWRRLLFYWWLNPCYELVFGGRYLDEGTVRRGIDAVRTRLAALGELRDRRP